MPSSFEPSADSLKVADPFSPFHGWVKEKVRVRALGGEGASGDDPLLGGRLDPVTKDRPRLAGAECDPAEVGVPLGRVCLGSAWANRAEPLLARSVMIAKAT